MGRERGGEEREGEREREGRRERRERGKRDRLQCIGWRPASGTRDEAGL